jgi:DNA-binding MarR family transcriptional regulator
MNTADDKLSKQQCTILLWLFDYIEKLEKHLEKHSDHATARDLLAQGVPWKLKVANNCRRASISRTLARLERRGFLDRVAPNGRATRVRLTQLGRFTAQKLKAEKALLTD